MNQAIADALNAQIALEVHSSNAYLGMHIYFARLGLRNLASFFLRQSEEEREHALKFIGHMLDLDFDDSPAIPAVGAVGAVPNQYDSPVAAARAALAQERKVSGAIHRILDLARQHDDKATAGFLMWFVKEQVEEEATMQELITVLDLAGTNLLYADEVAGRRFAEGHHEG